MLTEAMTSCQNAPEMQRWTSGRRKCAGSAGVNCTAWPRANNYVRTSKIKQPASFDRSTMVSYAENRYDNHSDYLIGCIFICHDDNFVLVAQSCLGCKPAWMTWEHLDEGLRQPSTQTAAIAAAELICALFQELARLIIGTIPKAAQHKIWRQRHRPLPDT